MKMFRAILAVFILISLLSFALPEKTAFAMSGTGTEGDPYIITTVNELQDMELDLTAYYKLGNDINASATTGWNAGAGFVPVGAGGTAFTGGLDGDHHSITGLFINRTTAQKVGLFGAAGAGGGQIKDLQLLSVNITGKLYVGGLIGEQGDEGDVSGVTVTGYVAGYSNIVNGMSGPVGGLVGYSTGSDTQSSFAGTVKCTYAGTSIFDDGIIGVGGLIGEWSGSGYSIAGSSANASIVVSSTRRVISVGGFIGQSTGGTIDTSSSSGSISVSATNTIFFVGGFIGYDSGEGTANCYSTSSIAVTAGNTGGSYGIGGFDGYSYVQVDKAYTAASLSAGGISTDVGGFIGYDNYGATNSFWDKTVGYPTSPSGSGEITASMITSTIYTSAGWNFGSIWVITPGINNHYPYISLSSAPTLVSIDVTPENPRIIPGQTEQFTAIGTYSDSSTANLTSTAEWSSSNESVATIEEDTGLATGIASHMTVITATSGSVSGNTSLTVPMGIPDNTDDWVFSNFAYADNISISVNGNPALLYRPEKIIIGTTLVDLLNTQNGTITWGSNPVGVNATLTSFQPYEGNLAIAPAYEITNGPGFISANLTMSGNFTAGSVPPGGPPGAGFIEEVAASGGTPPIFLYGVLVGFTLVVIGAFISWMEKEYTTGLGNLILRVAITTAVLGIMIAFKKFDFWMLIFYFFIVLAPASASRHMDWGGNTSQLNLIGALAQIWVGLTSISRIMEAQFITTTETNFLNNFAFTQQFQIQNFVTLPVINFNFITGLLHLFKFDYGFFGGNAQIIQYGLYSLITVGGFIVFSMLIYMLFGYFKQLPG